MRIAVVEVIPFALPFASPMSRRRELYRREMALLRLRDEAAWRVSGKRCRCRCGEARPWPWSSRSSSGSAERESLDEAPCAASPLSPPAAAPIWPRCSTCAAGAAAEARSPLGAGSPGPRATRLLPPASPRPVAAEAERWAARGFTTFKLKVGAGDDVGQVGRCARRSVPTRGSGSTPTAPGSCHGARSPAELEPLRDRAGRAARRRPRGPRPGRADLDPDRRRRERRDPRRRRAGHRPGACAARHGQARQGRRVPEAALEIAAVLPAYLSSALDGPVGIAAAAHVAQALREWPARPPLAHGLATQRLFASTVASVECELRDGFSTCRTAPAWASRSTRRPSSGPASSLAGRSHALREQAPRLDPTNANTALASAFVEELARCGVRARRHRPRLALDAARAGALAPAGDRRRRVIVDERSAAFFALGAAQASGAARRGALHLGDRGRQPPPGDLRGRRVGVPLIALTADRPPELRGIGAGQTIDQLKLYGASVRWFCEVGTHEADDAACSTTARPPAAPSPRRAATRARVPCT